MKFSYKGPSVCTMLFCIVLDPFEYISDIVEYPVVVAS